MERKCWFLIICSSDTWRTSNTCLIIIIISSSSTINIRSITNIKFKLPSSRNIIWGSWKWWWWVLLLLVLFCWGFWTWRGAESLTYKGILVLYHRFITKRWRLIIGNIIFICNIQLCRYIISFRLTTCFQLFLTCRFFYNR